MPGNLDVAAMGARLDATFQRVATLSRLDLEAQSDFARYLCVLVCGFVENAVTVLTIAYCRRRSPAAVANYAGAQLSRLQNLNGERLAQVVGAFDRQWREALIAFMEGPRKDALDSVLGLRNQIAHGASVGVTYGRIREYYARVRKVVDFVEERFD